MTKPTCIALVVSALLMLAGHSARSATVDVKTGKDQRAPIIALDGEILAGDFDKFSAAVGDNYGAVLVLSSPGGATLDALDIGRMVSRMGMVTYAKAGASCSSACALIWLAGKSRYVGRSAQVGFHATSSEENGKVEVSGFGNALVGAYLAELGMSADAIVFMNEASPMSMQYLDLEKAKEIGVVAAFDTAPDAVLVNDSAQADADLRRAAAEGSIVPVTPGYTEKTGLGESTPARTVNCKTVYDRLIGDKEVLGTEKTQPLACQGKAFAEPEAGRKVDFVTR